MQVTTIVKTLSGHLLGAVAAGLVLALALAAVDAPARAQTRLPGPAASPEAVPELPADLTPETVDALLARLTDAEIRALLRDELRRRADERAAAAMAPDRTLADLRARLAGLAATDAERLADWGEALMHIGERGNEVRARLARASNGIWGMIADTLAVAAAGIAAAFAIGWLTRSWRQWLMTPRMAGYWDRVVRTAALALVELAPVAAFDFATVSTAPLVAAALGPMIDYVWIYEVGVVNSWGFIVLSRRAFAPDAPALRIAQLSDAAAAGIHSVVRRAVQIGAAGWLIAGLSPTLGLGFPPALSTVTLAGTAVAGLLVIAVVRNYRAIRSAVAGLLIGVGAEPAALARIAVAAAPVGLIAYLAFAWLYWVALWIETGQQHLYGPVGTLVLLLTLPIFDRLGLELATGTIRGEGAGAGRFRQVMHGTWRMLIGIAVVFTVARLWGLDLYGLAKGPGAAPWAGTAFDIAVTLLLAHFVWRLILAGLHPDRPVVSDGAEESGEVAAASRLDTLVPLFRSVLLTILAVVVVMILLASAGVNIGPLLASAGIVGIAVGFGAQALVRDIFSGAFFLLDDAFRVGEYIELDQDLRGEVEAISIRSLRLRHHRSPVVTIPFGELKSVTNHNRDWVIYKMSFRMEPDVDPKVVKKLVKEVGKEFLAHPEHGPKFLEPLKSQGVYMIDDDSAQVFRVKFKCRPRAQFVLRREIYHRLREVFAEHGLGFARRKVEVIGSGIEAAAAAALPEDGAAA